MKNWLILIFVLFVSLAFGQKKEVAEINGERCYVHQVQSGETLWSLHRLYQVEVQVIERKNPTVTNGLREGQTVFIPVPKTEKKVVHEVAKGETLFAISRKYGVSVEELISANPAAENGLKAGQKLSIVQVVYQDEVTNVKPELNLQEQNPEVPVKPQPAVPDLNVAVKEHTVQDGETMYSICKRYMASQEEVLKLNKLTSTAVKPGQVLKIPVKKEANTNPEVRPVPEAVAVKIDSTLLFKKKDSYNVAILLPFYLDRPEGYSAALSQVATEFYMGVEMAIDSLQRSGLKANVKIFDTQNDSITVLNTLNDPFFSQVDMVIGPIMPKGVKEVADWCKAHQVRMVCPVSIDDKFLQSNSFVTAAVPTDKILMKRLADYTVRDHKSAKVVLIKPAASSDLELYTAYKAQLEKLNKSSVIVTSLSDFSGYLSPSEDVLVVLPTANKAEGRKLFTELNRFSHKTRSGKTFVFTTKEIAQLEDIKGVYKNKFNVTFPNSLDMSYTYDLTKAYTRKFRSAYKYEFTKYAMQGFDVTYFFLKYYLQNQTVKRLAMNEFFISSKGDGNGSVNSTAFIQQFQEFEIINMAVIHE